MKAVGWCNALRASPIPDFEAIVMGKLRDGEILLMRVIGDGVAINPFLGSAYGVGEMVFQSGPILLCLLTHHLNYNSNCNNQTPSIPIAHLLSPKYPDIFLSGKLDKFV